jgi:hypothetical protein
MERDFLRSGVFNLGFIGVSNRQAARAFLDWWEERCLNEGLSEQRAGLFVDQKWINLALCLFPSIDIVRDPGCNVAYWNLHERELSVSDGRFMVNGSYELKFFHFSGINPNDPSRISKHQDRFTLRDRGDLVPLFKPYCRELLKNKEASGIAGKRYAFGYFSNGIMVSLLARRVYAFSLDKFSQPDPFDATGEFFTFARKRRLLSNTDRSDSYNALNFDPKDFRLNMVHLGLRLIRRVLGADRYTMLMRYMGHIAILHNQRPLFWRD